MSTDHKRIQKFYLPVSLTFFDFFDRDFDFFGAATAPSFGSSTTDCCERVTKFEDKRFLLEIINKQMNKRIKMLDKIALTEYI